MYVDSFAHFLGIGKIEYMIDNFGLPKEKDEGMSTNTKMAIAGAALLAVTAGTMYENDQDATQESKRTESAQKYEAKSVKEGYPMRESIPPGAMLAVEEYKSILGATWSIPFVPGADSEQEKMIESIAQKHGVSKNDFAQALRYKFSDAGIE